MAQNTEIEQLIRELNDPRHQSSPEVIDMIQKRIQRLQREFQAWQWGIDLLNHGEAVMRFYGALTLTIKINADWDTDKIGEDRDSINHLLENLVSSYVRLAAIPDVPFVLQKLCTTLVAIFQKPQSAWALPIRHLTACTVANQYISQDATPELTLSLGSRGVISGAQLRSLLIFPMTLAEEDRAISGAMKEQSIRVRISNNLTDILRILHFASKSLENSGTENALNGSNTYALAVEYDARSFLDTARTLLQLVPLWTSDIKVKNARQDRLTTDTKFELFQATVKIFPQLFQEAALSSLVTQAFTMLEESSHKLLERALPGYEEYIIKSTQAASWLEQLISGDFDSDAMTYMNFLEACMSQIDVTSPEYLSAGPYIEILTQVRTLLQCDGAPGVEDTVCQVALEILTSVTEGFSDWDGPTEYDESMKNLVKDTCGSTLNKIRIPFDELSIKTQTWDTDDRAKFQDFRYDVQDYLQNAFGILGDDLIEEITKIIIEARSNMELNLFESGLFSLLAFSDTLSNEPERYDKYLTAIFSCENWHNIVHALTDVPDRVRQIMIKVMGENTGFLQRNTEYLVGSLNFLFTSLYMDSTATAASRAIYTLCDTQRFILTEALPQFMSSLNKTSSIEPDAKHRIYGAVGAVISALRSEELKVEPLTRILDDLIEKEVDQEVDPATTHEDLVSKAADAMYTVAALGRGLRAPSDTPIDLEKAVQDESRFWLDGPGSIVQRKVLKIHNTLQEQNNGQENASFVEAACDVLKAGFTEDHPSPFKFSNAKILEVLSIYMQLTCPRPDRVMSTGSSYLASVEPTDPDNEFYALFMMSIRVVNDIYVNFKTHGQSLNSDFCTSALNFYATLLPKWAPLLFSLREAPEAIGLIIELSLLLVEDTDTLPRRTSASFLTALFEASSQPAVLSSAEASSSMTTTLQTYAPRVIALIIHLLGGVCARSDIDALAETLKKAVAKQALLTNKLLKEAVKDENAVLTPRALQATKPEQRARFASQIEMLRGSRKTNEVIREFWIACKGREFEYLG